MKKITGIVLAVSIMFFCFSAVGLAADDDGAILTVNTALQVEVNAKACVLMDTNTGTVLVANNEDEQLYPASVTKIMTLLLVCEALDEGKLSLDMNLTCSDTAALKGGSQIWLEPGEVMSVKDLLKAAVVYSANDACALLGEAVAGSEEAFVALMNEKAQALGMNNTHFDNCTGLDDDTEAHKTTAYDIALMSRALLSHDIIKEYTGIWMDTLRGGETQLVNTNKLIRYYSGANGLKTGTTSKAGCCISASAERDGLELVAVVLGAANSNDRFNGARALLDWGFANYEIYKPSIDAAALPQIPVAHGVKAELQLCAPDTHELLVNRGAGAKIEQSLSFPESVEAPIEKGQAIGKAVFSAGGTKIAEYDICAAESVEQMTLSNALLALLKSFKVCK